MPSRFHGFGVLFTGLLFVGCVTAAGSYPVPLSMPDIEYPEELIGSSVKGEVVVRIFIQADGGVRFLEVLDATEPRFVAATKKAVEQWRFEPWTPPASNPEGEAVKVTYHFLGKPYKEPSLTANVELKKVSCRQLNEEVESNWRKSGRSHEAETLARTEFYLSSGNVIYPFLPGDAREALVMEFINAIPGILKNCQKNPQRNYVDYLPENVRRNL
ncbi:energy transducer TonB [Pseudomonas lijiangensis]|uniref:energy transducer TonB n=1 Tax=Pseudomonas syringae group TaxID=136849 RepID=UPI001E4CEC58|nr:energy transducer TonB [Pseudomonas cichorii]